MQKILFAIAMLATATASINANAEVMLECHEPMGHLYADGHGWVEDGFTGGKFSLVKDGDQFDIIITDAFGTRSAKADGAVVVSTEVTADALTLIAAYPHALETYLFSFEKSLMLLTTLKLSGGPARGGVYHATCE